MVIIRALIYYFALAAVKFGYVDRKPFLITVMNIVSISIPYVACRKCINFLVFILSKI
jgi:hypothetical protein